MWVRHGKDHPADFLWGLGELRDWGRGQVPAPLSRGKYSQGLDKRPWGVGWVDRNNGTEYCF